MPCRANRGRRAAVLLVGYFECGGISFFFPVFFPVNAHGLWHVSGSLASYTSLLLVLGCAQVSII